MQSLQCAACAACAAPLRPDAAGHGHYRMKSASISAAVAACSRPCGAIGLMLVAIGAPPPPTKRTADDAEMDTNEPKAGRGEPVVMSAQRQADRRRVVRWLYVLRAEMERMYAYPSGLRSTERLKATVLLIGDDIQITNAEALELLRPLDERLRTMLAAIDDPAMPDYDIGAIGDVARNIVRRITQREQMEALAPALRPESYLGWVPRDVQNMVAAFAAPSAMPYSMVEIPRSHHTVFLKQYMCTFQTNSDYWLAYQYNGAQLPYIRNYEESSTRFRREDNLVWYFEPDNADIGDIIRIEAVFGQILWNLTRRDGTNQHKLFDFDGFPICADISRNLLWCFSSGGKHITKIIIHSDGITQAPIAPNSVSRMIKNYNTDASTLRWASTAIKDGFYLQRRDTLITVCNVEAGEIRKITIPHELSEAKFDYGSDGMFYAFAFTDSLPTLARYASVPHIIEITDFNRHGHKWIEGTRTTIRMDGSRVIMISHFYRHPVDYFVRVCIVDTKLL